MVFSTATENKPSATLGVGTGAYAVLTVPWLCAEKHQNSQVLPKGRHRRMQLGGGHMAAIEVRREI